MSYLRVITWALKHGGIGALLDAIGAYSDLKLSADFWKEHKISINYKRPLKIRFYGGLSMLEEIFINRIYDCKIESNSPTIVDIGANVGFYSIWAAINYPHAKIFAYEPVSKTYCLLEKNVTDNSLEKTITTCKKAIGQKKGQATIYLSYASGLSSLKKMSEHPEKIDVITLGDIFQENGLEKIDVLKIDTEGSECDILGSSSKYLSRVGNILLEYHSKNDLKKLLSILKKNGFEVLKVTGDDVGTLIAKNMNYK